MYIRMTKTYYYTKDFNNAYDLKLRSFTWKFIFSTLGRWPLIRQNLLCWGLSLRLGFKPISIQALSGRFIVTLRMQLLDSHTPWLWNPRHPIKCQPGNCFFLQQTITVTPFWLWENLCKQLHFRKIKTKNTEKNKQTLFWRDKDKTKGLFQSYFILATRAL